MSSRPSRRNASKTDQAKQKLEQLKQLKETKGKKRLDDIDGDEDVANVYDEVGGFFVFVFSSLVALFLIKSRAKRKVLVLRLNSKKFRAKKQHFRSEESVCSLLTHSRLFFVLTLRGRTTREKWISNFSSSSSTSSLRSQNSINTRNDSI